MLGPGLRWVVEAIRTPPEDKPLIDFAIGRPLPAATVEATIPHDVLGALEVEGLLDHDEGADELRLTVHCAPINGLVSVMPGRQRVDAEFVHLNSDTFWLIQLAWRHGEPGDYAVELGTGNGLVAAHLVARYRRVLATDLVGPWLHYAQLTLEANQGRGRPSAVIAADVARGLRPGAFDLVVANAPWSPNPGADVDGNDFVFMDGGPTGTELPARFLVEGADLLAPGGTAITLCLDPTFDDGSRPLVPILEGLERRGLTVETVDSPVFDADTVTEGLRRHRRSDLLEARHLAVIVHRPSTLGG